MPRGSAAKPGDTNVSDNGYHYTRTDTKWRLTHHIIAEEKLGRPLRDTEMVKFKDKDRKNLKPSNIEIIEKGQSSYRRKRAQLVARIEELQGQLAELDREHEESLKVSS